MASAPDTSSSSAADGAQLAELADQLQALARELRFAQPTIEMATRNGANAAEPESSECGQSSPLKLVTGIEKSAFLSFARARYNARRKRGAIFGGVDLFGEPAWDILLDLYIAHGQNKAVSVSSACIGSASPPTTGLRRLGVLQESGLVEREHDPRDQRRVLVRLSKEGVDRMERYFREAMAVHAA